MEDGQLLAAIAALWGVITAIALAYYRDLKAQRDECCKERDVLRNEVNDAVKTYRARDDAERESWRQHAQNQGGVAPSREHRP